MSALTSTSKDMRYHAVSTELPQIRVVKPNDKGIIPDRKEALLRRLDNVESALGRMLVVVREIRADVAHLTIES